MVQDDGPAGLDGVGVRFDDRRAVANAGIVLVATLAARLGIEALVDRVVCLGERAGAANPGRKLVTLVYAMALGADSIDDCDVLRSGGTGRLLGGRLAALSTGLSDEVCVVVVSDPVSCAGRFEAGAPEGRAARTARRAAREGTYHHDQHEVRAARRRGGRRARCAAA